MTTTVADNSGRSRFEISVDGNPAGFAAYERRESRVAFTHTEIGSEFSGQGLASTLIRAALDEARERNWQVEPFCPFVRGFIAKHPDYQQLVPSEERARFELE